MTANHGLQENPAALRQYFSEDFSFHGPGTEMNFSQLEGSFDQMRKSFSAYYCERHEIVSSGSLVGCRTEMGGIFDTAFEASPFGTVQPHGRSVTLTLINMFRYDDEGKLAEEWVPYDNVEWMHQLGVELAPQF